MKILMLTENDPAGMGIAFTKAINQYTEHSCRLITTAEKYCFGYEKDLHIGDWGQLTRRKQTEVEETLEQADIFTFHILSDDSMEIGPLKVKEYLKKKPVVHWHHGCDDFRNNPDKYRLKYRKLKRKVLVSTPDLLLGMPNAYWMPNLIPIDDPDYMPTEERYPEFTIGQSPTRTDLKDTGVLLEAANKTGVAVDIIMNTPHRECLRRKQKCHVIFDHLRGYYGVSSLEGLSMGKPVIANLSEWVERNIKDFAETERLPWVNCKTAEKIDLIWLNDRLFLKAMSGLSRLFMIGYWSDEKVANRLIKFYEGL